MAEETQDQSQKTEEPTHKRIEDARKKGQVAASREVNHWFMILAATVVMMMVAPGLMKQLRGLFVKFIGQPHQLPTDFNSLHVMLIELISAVGMALLPLTLLLVAAALLAGLVQNGLMFAPDQLKPKFEKISMLKGVKRLFSSRSLIEFLKGVFKLAIVGAVAVILMIPEFNRLEEFSSQSIAASLGLLHGLAVKLLIGVLAIVSLIAVLDILYQRMMHTKQMKMSRQEIKDELKQTEGDPIVRGRLRQIRRERAQKRMMAAVPEATVVVTNPTHFAVALKYDLDEMPAPMVVAKGADHIARRIREIAKENDVPILENPPLAQALHAGVEIGEEVPEQHYKAVAEIISYVLKLKGKLPQRRRGAG